MLSQKGHTEFNSDVCDCGSFFLDLVGRFGPQDISVQWSHQERQSNPEIQELIERTWAAETEKAILGNKVLFNGPLCRLIKLDASQRQVVLTVGPVTFKEFLGTNLTAAHIRHTHGSDVMADPLGMSAAIISSDGYVLLGKRSGTVVFYPHRIHPIAGIVQPCHSASAPDPFDAILSELQQELGVERESIKQVACLGLVRDKHIAQPELVFQARVNKTVRQMRLTRKTARDSGENDDLVCIRDYPSAVVTFMEHNSALLTPVARASLLLHGLASWGTGWFTTARGYLRSVVC